MAWVLLFLGLAALCLHSTFASRTMPCLARAPILMTGGSGSDDAPLASEEPSSRSNAGGLQYMITRKMRGVLLEELGYLPDEVDDMEPRVAAVVIERALRRPVNGMPSAWRRPDALAERRMRALLKRFHQVQSGVRKAATFAQVYLRPLLPAITLGLAAWYQRETLAHLARTAWKSLQAAQVRVLQRSGQLLSRGGKGTRQQHATIDLDTFHQACRPSFWERWGPRRRRSPSLVL